MGKKLLEIKVAIHIRKSANEVFEAIATWQKCPNILFEYGINLRNGAFDFMASDLNRNL